MRSVHILSLTAIGTPSTTLLACPWGRGVKWRRRRNFKQHGMNKEQWSKHTFKPSRLRLTCLLLKIIFVFDTYVCVDSFSSVFNISPTFFHDIIRVNLMRVAKLIELRKAGQHRMETVKWSEVWVVTSAMVESVRILVEMAGFSPLHKWLPTVLTFIACPMNTQ